MTSANTDTYRQLLAHARVAVADVEQVGTAPGGQVALCVLTNVVAVKGDFAYVRPMRSYPTDRMDTEHRGTIVAVHAATSDLPGDVCVTVEFDDLPDGVRSVQDFYVDEIRHTRRRKPPAS